MKSNEQVVEEMIVEKSLDAPRLRPEDIDKVIKSETYSILPSEKSMVCELTLVNGFTVRGESSCVSKENFDEEVGKRVAFDNARKKIWELEGYLLQQRISEKVINDEN